jgi:transposase InsO family protein
MTGMTLPNYLSSDHHPLFEYHRWKANLRVLGVEEIKSVPYVPLSHPFVERLIGTVRREYLDHVLFWNAMDLERKLEAFRRYYNEHRVHASLDGDTPAQVCGRSFNQQADLEDFRWGTYCRGLVQLPLAA